MKKIALITGATSGIGKATAIQFAQNNYQLILTGRRNDRLVALKNELSASYQTAILTLNFDVQDNEAVQNALASLPADWKKIDVLVTAPINKHTIQEAGFNYPGHTEYLGEKLGGTPLMLLCANDLRIAVVTGHVPLKNISEKISKENVYNKIIQLHTSLVKDFGIRKPKIAVLGLNPHAGENGAIGDEEMKSIIPAIEKAKDTMFVYGPYSADGFFGKNTQAQFDGVLAMYHDQGLIPFKTLAFGTGVNFTAGLDFVRTSPDHGTAYDIAGKQMADESSFREAIYTAIDIYRNRTLLNEISAKPLAFSPIKKERG